MALPVTPFTTDFTSMIAHVRTLLGRTGDNELLTQAVVGIFLNLRQRQIAQMHPRLRDLAVEDTTLTFATDDYDVSIASLSVNWHHVESVTRENSGQTTYDELRFVPPATFDKNFPALATLSSGLPRFYTRKANVLYFYPKPSASYNGDTIILRGYKWPATMTLSPSTTPNVSGSEQALIAGAMADGYLAIGNQPERVNTWEARFLAYADQVAAEQAVQLDGRRSLLE